MKFNILVETKSENNEKFVDKRSDGAADIAKKAAAKGGYAQLTAWHFEAKAEPYKEALMAIEDGKPVEFFQKKYDEAMKKLHSSGMDSQKTFQTLMGVVEVWGEVLLQVKSGHTY